MVEIQPGGVYRAAMVKSGTTDRGEWQLVKVADEKRKSGGATFFVSNPIPGLAEGDSFRVDNAVNLKWKAKQSKKHPGEWDDVVDVTLHISRADGSAGPEFAEIEDDADGQLPF